MSWAELMTSSILGLSFSMVAIAITVYQGIRYYVYVGKKDIHETVQALKARKVELDAEIADQRLEFFQAQDTIQLAKKQKDWMEQTKEELRELEHCQKLLSDTTLELDEKRQSVEELQSSIDEKLQLLRELQQVVPSPEEVDRKKTEFLELSRRLAEKQSAMVELQPKVERLQREHDQLQGENTELAKQNSVMEARIAADQERADSLKQQIEDLKSTLEGIYSASGKTDPEGATQLLWEPAVHHTDYKSAREDTLDEETALALASDRIAKSGLKYDDRVLKAFHTSLKCSEESPLLVLAGISGTGKSALPTRYAEAMGMHLLNVPVQPSWDSPADLLGFYNHLEGRFRPTELTRALLQFDYVYGADGGSPGWPERSRDWEGLSDRMLLVLLDEMNLARVEYYFSEFLSRLELRRGIDPERDPVARGRAELLLDLGRSGKGEHQSLPTYVGRNVLFVGTMNEDESTQTLSDKVIDRSNLMRFGRPKNLLVNSAGDLRSSRSEGYLTRRVWERWVKAPRELGGNETALLNQWIEAANQALDRLGKPFAFRVAEAMRTYVRQYPDRGEQGLRDAFADQVELRVLPRLRGVDTHEKASQDAIHDVIRLVDNELNDDVLASALKDALRASGDQLFQWPGVDRMQTDLIGS